MKEKINPATKVYGLRGCSSYVAPAHPKLNCALKHAKPLFADLALSGRKSKEEGGKTSASLASNSSILNTHASTQLRADFRSLSSVIAIKGEEGKGKKQSLSALIA